MAKLKSRHAPRAIVADLSYADQAAIRRSRVRDRRNRYPRQFGRRSAPIRSG
jgi:hypothetical protein